MRLSVSGSIPLIPHIVSGTPCGIDVRAMPDNRGPDYVMFSPNVDNKGGQFYCVVGTCRSRGENYWDKSGRAGGP